MKNRRSILQEEIQQSRPFRSASQEAALGLFRTTGLVRRVHSRVVEDRDLSLQQYNALRILRGAGPGGLPTLGVNARMVEPMLGITRLIDRLVGKGLVSRERSTEDRRQVVCRITDEGLELLAEIDPAIDEADDQCLAMLTTEEQRRLVEILDKVRLSYAETEDDSSD